MNQVTVLFGDGAKLSYRVGSGALGVAVGDQVVVPKRGDYVSHAEEAGTVVSLRGDYQGVLRPILRVLTLPAYHVFLDYSPMPCGVTSGDTFQDALSHAGLRYGSKAVTGLGKVKPYEAPLPSWRVTYPDGVAATYTGVDIVDVTEQLAVRPSKVVSIERIAT